MSDSQGSSTSSSSSTSVKRLASFKEPRDLLCLASNINLKPPSVNTKKQFVPNLNVTRKKNIEPSPVVKKREIVDTRRDKSKFGAGRNKKDKTFVQTTSVFSEGIAAAEKKSSLSGGYGFGNSEGCSKANLPAPKLNLERNKHLDKSIDEKTLHTLLRDDFIDDENDVDEDDMKDVKTPIQLPLKCETSKNKSDLTKMLDCDNIIEEPKFLFFQFPDSLPISCTTAENKETACFSLKNVPPGRLGTIQIMKSGKMRLVQGDKIFHLHQSTQSTFHQDVVSCQTNEETKTGIMASLGPITSRIVVTPDWNSLMASS